VNASLPLNSQQLAEFARDGILIVKGFYDRKAQILPIQRGIYDLIGEVLKRHNLADEREPFAPEHFDDGYQRLIGINRAWGGEIYDAVKQLPPFYRLISAQVHDAIFRQLRPASVPGLAAGGYGIRIDNPNEEKYRALWHQEYPAQLRSVDGLVFWSPLVPVTLPMGPVIFCPGSHREGPLPVHSADPDQSGRSGAYSLALWEEDRILARYEKVTPLTEPTDLVIVDFLVLHASGHNRSTRSRWSMQFRYFNFADPVGRSHAWKGSFAAGVDFRSIHPELYKTP
jgi:hypothetical protein